MFWLVVLPLILRFLQVVYRLLQPLLTPETMQEDPKVMLYEECDGRDIQSVIILNEWSKTGILVPEKSAI